MRVLYTGDRAAFPPAAFPAIAIDIMKRQAVCLGTLQTFVPITGQFKGVEQAVQALCATAEVPVEVIPEVPAFEPDPASKLDLAAWTTHLQGMQLDTIVFVHSDPMMSSLYKALIEVPALAEKVELVLPTVVLIAAVEVPE